MVSRKKTKIIVADNSVIVPLFLPDENADCSKKLLRQTSKGHEIISPLFCISEFGNVITVSVRRKRLSQSEADQAFRAFAKLPVKFVPAMSLENTNSIYEIATTRNLSFYDAIYLELAIKSRAMLASLDKTLISAAKAYGVEIFS